MMVHRVRIVSGNRMPIDMEEFETADDDFFRGGSEVEVNKVLEFLAFNPQKAYSRQEIQNALGMRTIELIFTLSRLEKEGLVRHKGEYWTVAESADVPEQQGQAPPTDD